MCELYVGKEEGYCTHPSAILEPKDLSNSDEHTQNEADRDEDDGGSEHVEGHALRLPIR